MKSIRYKVYYDTWAKREGEREREKKIINRGYARLYSKNPKKKEEMVKYINSGIKFDNNKYNQKLQCF